MLSANYISAKLGFITKAQPPTGEVMPPEAGPPPDEAAGAPLPPEGATPGGALPGAATQMPQTTTPEQLSKLKESLLEATSDELGDEEETDFLIEDPALYGDS